MEKSEDKEIIARNIDVAQRCSQSCIRSGVLALTLSGIAIILSPFLQNEQDKFIFSVYSMQRENIEESIQKVEGSECWRDLEARSGNESLNELKLQELIEKECTLSIKPALRVGAIGPKPSSDVKAKKSLELSDSSLEDDKAIVDKIPPLRPTNVRIIFKHKLSLTSLIIPLLITTDDKFIQKIQALKNLEISESSRINEWKTFTNELLLKANSSSKKESKNEEGILKKQLSLKSVEKSNAIYLLSWKDIKKLSIVAFPEKQNNQKTQQVNPVIQLPWISIETEIRTLITLIELGIFLCVAYFWLFLREGTSLPKMTTSGTLLGVMAKDRYSFSLIFLILSIPPIVSIFLSTSLDFSQFNFDTFKMTINPAQETITEKLDINKIFAAFNLLLFFAISYLLAKRLSL